LHLSVADGLGVDALVHGDAKALEDGDLSSHLVEEHDVFVIFSFLALRDGVNHIVSLHGPSFPGNDIFGIGHHGALLLDWFGSFVQRNFLGVLRVDVVGRKNIFLLGVGIVAHLGCVHGTRLGCVLHLGTRGLRVLLHLDNGSGGRCLLNWFGLCRYRVGLLLGLRGGGDLGRSDLYGLWLLLLGLGRRLLWFRWSGG